ncbi:MAG: lytic transglycosylase domain-containing protein [Deltaproteobacteria bacterium]|nr:lytic transglycosylase domain-containing protein [Deltaproteobacteria bacterium]
MRAAWLNLSFLLLLLLLTTCVHEMSQIKILSEKVRKNYEKQSVNRQIRNLELLRSEYPDLRLLTEDVYLMLRAIRAENSGQLDDARQFWEDGLSMESDDFAEDLFRGWLALFLREQRTVSDYKRLSHLILEETTQFGGSYFLASKGLRDEKKLSVWLGDLLQDTEKGIAKKSDQLVALERLRAPESDGVPPDDVLLQNTSARYCRSEHHDDMMWIKWRKSLGKLGQAYWDALILNCSQQPEAAMHSLEVTLGQHQKAPDERDNYLIIAMHELLVLLFRRNDARDKAASWYRSLMDSWELAAVTPESMGLDLQSFFFRRIDDTLWAARYRSLIGDYDYGQRYVQQARRLIDEARSKLPELSQDVSEQLIEYHAESLHVLSFRIAMEQKEFRRASEIARDGLEIPHLKEEWRDRFLWFQGFYSLLDGDLNQAWDLWWRLKEQTQEDSQRYKSLFWLSWLAHKKGLTGQSRELIDELGREAPLDYYYLVAPSLAGMPDAEHWKSRFQRSHTESPYRNDPYRDKISVLQNRPDLMPLATKTEGLLLADLPNMAFPVCNRLANTLAKTVSLSSDPEVYLYLSRLLYSSGNYSRAIYLSKKLSSSHEDFWKQHPDQLYILFPKAYDKSFLKYSKQHAVSASLLYAITHQESNFRSDARSYANAIGLMQLIPVTASRVATWGRQAFPEQHVEERLLEAETNINLGSLYLKFLAERYKSNLPAIIASYNAGEYAVDIWMRRRFHPDPLLWIEMIPFGETKSYVQKVLRNKLVYDYLDTVQGGIAFRPASLTGRQASAGNSM